MDLLRSTIESFYFSMPLSALAQCVIKPSKQNKMRDYLVEIVNRNNPEFTVSEMTLLGRMLDDIWLNSPHFSILPENTGFLDRIPLLLNNFSSSVLLCSNLDYPKVQFNELLRWRQLTMKLGEDLFTLPFLAELDLKRNINRSDFAWPNVIDHDNQRLNVVLKEILSDTHSHINAAIDVFEFNWIWMMNSPRSLDSTSKKTAYLAEGAAQEYDYVTHHSDFNLNLLQWVFIAAEIRLMVFTTINGEKSRFTPNRIKQILKDPKSFAASKEDLENEIERLTDKSLRLNLETRSCGRFGFDYAIRASDFPLVDGNAAVSGSPYLIHQGERKFIYNWFSGYYGGDSRLKALTPFMMLYLVIKAKIRREYIQTNDLSGFRNFQIYQGRKDTFLRIKDDVKKDHYKEVAYRYAVQSSIGTDGIHNIEARLTPESITDSRLLDYRAAIFHHGGTYPIRANNQVTYVIHLLKTPDDEELAGSSYRHSNAREKFWEQIKVVVNEFHRNNAGEYPDITGIDAAGNELVCRPEVLAPMFRYARNCGISRFTYHAGEDFYDISDGLRTIDELMEFMEYTMGDRIGHGLALGVDAGKFYSSRHHTLIIPRQTLLDNLVWLKYKAREYRIGLSSDTEFFIERNFNEIARDLGYFPISQSMYEYYCSMKMRGNIIDEKSTGLVSELNDDILYSRCSMNYRYTQVINDLHQHYETNAQCREKGRIPIMTKLNASYAADISMLQEAMLADIEHKGIVIETNPSSNLKIGRFDRYDEHPITLFNSVTPNADGHSIMVSINTDDKGVFATSLQNEFSLIAIALKKQKDSAGNRLYSEGQIEEYLRRIARYGNTSRFQ